VRPNVKEGDLICFSGHGAVSALIRLLTKSRYSHVGLLFMYEGRRYCLESVGAGGRVALLSHVVEHYEGGIEYHELDGPDDTQRHRAVGFAFRQLGKPYDKRGIFKFLKRILFGTREKVVRDDLWFCSELVAEAYRASGFPLVDEVPQYVSPSDLVASRHVKYRHTLKKA
jgi:uncharacterized protein YycO